MIIILPGFYLSLYRPSHKIIIFFPLFLEKSPESKSAQGHESPNTVLGKAVTIFTPADAFMFLPSTWTLHCTLFFFKLFLFVFVFRPCHTGYSPGIARVGHDLVTKPSPPHSLWDLSSLIRDQTWVPCIRSLGS